MVALKVSDYSKSVRHLLSPWTCARGNGAWHLRRGLSAVTVPGDYPKIPRAQLFRPCDALRLADHGRIKSALNLHVKRRRVAHLCPYARAITRSVKARDADRQLSVQPEPTETYADNAATEFVKRWGHCAGMPSQMSQMVTVRLVCGALKHQDRRGVIGYLTDTDRVPMVAPSNQG